MRVTYDGWRVATWNVEGLTDIKVIQLQRVMEKRGIGMLCLQETHCNNSDYYSTAEGYLIILSGGLAEDRERAGVGMIVAPSVRSSLIGFCQISSRMMSAKVRVRGGKVAIWSTYAPHEGRPPDERQAFYTDLGRHLGQSSTHGATLVCGDFNARIHKQNPDEQDIVGPHVFGNPSARHIPGGNRDHLMELCVRRAGHVRCQHICRRPPKLPHNLL